MYIIFIHIIYITYLNTIISRVSILGARFLHSYLAYREGRQPYQVAAGCNDSHGYFQIAQARHLSCCLPMKPIWTKTADIHNHSYILPKTRLIDIDRCSDMVARRSPFLFGSFLVEPSVFWCSPSRCACGDFCQSVAGRVHRGAKCGTPSRPRGPGGSGGPGGWDGE